MTLGYKAKLGTGLISTKRHDQLKLFCLGPEFTMWEAYRQDLLEKMLSPGAENNCSYGATKREFSFLFLPLY